METLTPRQRVLKGNKFSVGKCKKDGHPMAVLFRLGGVSVREGKGSFHQMAVLFSC